MSESELVRMEIKGLVVDPTSSTPIVVLRDQDNTVFLPIWVGVFEASAIQLQMQGEQPPRPMTHDLLRSSLETLGVKVEKVVISDLRDGTFYALIHLLRDGRDALQIDARPSDAMALALRADAPIFVLRDVLDRAQAVNRAASVSDEEKLKKWFEELNPDDLGKYEM